MSGQFGEWAPKYRERGFWARPIRPGTKACLGKGWQRPDSEVSAEELARRYARYRRIGTDLPVV